MLPETGGRPQFGGVSSCWDKGQAISIKKGVLCVFGEYWEEVLILRLAYHLDLCISSTYSESLSLDIMTTTETPVSKIPILEVHSG